MMNRMKTVTVAATLASVVSLGALAVEAQTPGQRPVQQAGTGSPACLEAMHEMMTMMSEHMGTRMMGPGSEAMGGMMGPASSPGTVRSMDHECRALMGQMMGMMRDHMGAEMMRSGPSATPSPSSLDAHHPGTTDPAESAAAAVRVEVTLTDALRIEPAAMTVPVGVPVMFVVTNNGVMPHEFVVGDEATQEAHETAMQGMGSMTHDKADAIGVAPGATKELTITFARPGPTLAGCHVPGHYAAGMRAVISVTL